MKLNHPDKFDILPQGVLFDIDNTLYEYEVAHQAGMEAIRTKAIKQLSISAEDFEEAFFAARTEIKQGLPNTASSHNRLLYLQRTFERLGLGSQVLLSMDFEQTYWHSVLAKAALFPDVIEFLDELRLKNITRVVVTDLSANIQFRKLIYFGLDRHFEYVVTSEEAGQDKPHQKPFEIAVEKSNLADKRVWMIGDSLAKDIHGARKNLGAVTLQKVHACVPEILASDGADAVFTRFSDLRQFVSGIGK